MQALKEYVLNKCCRGCEHNAVHSEHICLYSGMSTCYHISTDIDDGIPNAFLCKGCYDKVAPEGGTPGTSELRQNAKAAQIEQGDRMRKYAQDRSQCRNKGNNIEVGTVV